MFLCPWCAVPDDPLSSLYLSFLGYARPLRSRSLCALPGTIWVGLGHEHEMIRRQECASWKKRGGRWYRPGRRDKKRSRGTECRCKRGSLDAVTILAGRVHACPIPPQQVNLSVNTKRKAQRKRHADRPHADGVGAGFFSATIFFPVLGFHGVYRARAPCYSLAIFFFIAIGCVGQEVWGAGTEEEEDWERRRCAPQRIGLTTTHTST